MHKGTEGHVDPELYMEGDIAIGVPANAFTLYIYFTIFIKTGQL